MLSPLVSWILSSSSSSSSSDYEEEEHSDSDDQDSLNDDIDDDENDHLSNEFEDAPGASFAVDAIPLASDAVTLAYPSEFPRSEFGPRKRRRIENSGRQSQRLWSEQDEMELLKGYLNHATQHQQTNSSIYRNSASFYGEIKPKLNFSCDRNKLFQKLRRLKRKYDTVLEKIKSGHGVPFRNPHDRAIFEISRKIWGTFSTSNDTGEDDPNLSVGVKIEEEDCDGIRGKTAGRRNDDRVKDLIEETVRSCISPLLKEFLSNAAPGELGLGEMALNPMAVRRGEQSGCGSGNGVGVDERWRNQRIMELEVYSKRLEMMQNKIKDELEELKNAK